MYRTAKHRDIVDDPVIRYKPVESLPGIGPVNGRRLRDGGFYTADQLLTQYLNLKRNEQRFTAWLSMVSGANALHAAQCFNGLNEWYYTWGRDAQISKKSITSPTNERGSMTNRMLLEQKMLQFNSNAHEDRLRSLFSNQTVSLVDISSTAKRPPFFLGQFTKSHCNIAENSFNHSLSDQIKKLSSPTSKSVNFKENVEFNAQVPIRSPISDLSKRPISPILKSRSLTPEIGKNNKNSSSLQIKSKGGNKRNEPYKKGSSMNNLNITGKIKNNNEALKAKSIENMCRSNTFTKSKPKSQASKQLNTKSSEKLVCTCNFPYTDGELLSSSKMVASKVQSSKKLNAEAPEKLVCTCDNSYPEAEIWNSSETESFKASQNIEKYFDEKLTDIENLKNSNTYSSTPLKTNQNCLESRTELQKNAAFKNNKSKELNNEEARIINVIEEQTSIHYDNSNEGDESDISSEYVITENNHMTSNENSVMLDSRDLEDVKIDDVCDGPIVEAYNEARKLEELVQVPPSNDSTSSAQLENPKNTFSECLHNDATNFDNSNEDSGLDVTPKSNCNYNEYSEGTQTTDDECSTPFENIDTPSEADTDRTYEINDTTDTESGFHFMSSNSGTTLEKVEETEDTEDNQNDEQQIDKNDQSEDELKRTNIKLFCDMLSSDLEQLPMDKFRKLKLKILEMVYSEIDKSVEK